MPSTDQPSTLGIITSSVTTSGGVSAPDLERLRAVVGVQQPVAFLGDGQAQHVVDGGIVVDHQHASLPAASPLSEIAASRRGTSDADLAPVRQVMVKVEPLPGVLATVMSPPSMVAEMLGDGEAEAGAAVIARGRGIGLGEGLEQPAHLLVAHADAGVRHREAEHRASGFRLCLRHRQRHRSALGEFRGVARAG